MEVEQVRVLLSTPPENLDRAAKKLELPLPTARDLRVQALNLVLGRCVLCGRHTLAGMCSGCKKNSPPWRWIPWSSIEFLQLLQPSDQLLRQVCSQCNRPFMLSAKYLLQKLLSKPLGDTRKMCSACLEAAQKAKRRLELQKIKEEERKKFEEKRKAIEERRKRKADAARRKKAREDFINKRRPKLFYRPFADNEELERLKKSLPKAPPRRHHPKVPKRG